MITNRLFVLAACSPLLAPGLPAQPAPPRSMVSGDVYRIKDVGPPEISPDGGWIAYTVSESDSATDRITTDIWLAAWDGSSIVRLTSRSSGAYAPRFSPDGKYLSFLASKPGGEGGAQLWLLDRAGGEAQLASDGPAGIEYYAWSPDSKWVVFVAKDPAPARPAIPKPIVVERWTFKQDVLGYLGTARSHLYLLDVRSHQTRPLTAGDFDDGSPAWAPDGSAIAFTSKRGTPDRSLDWGLFVIEPTPGALPKHLTTFPWSDSPPPGGSVTWSRDGRQIAFVRGGEPKYWQYDNPRIAIVPAAGGNPTVLAPQLDRQVTTPRWAPDGRAVFALLEDDRTVHLARLGLDGSVDRLTAGGFTLGSLAVGPDGRFAVNLSTDSLPGEIAVVEGGRIRRISHHNDSLMRAVRVSRAVDFTSTSMDGTTVNGILYLPPATEASNLPTVLLVHGGPFGQNQHDFDLRRHVFPANGYAVLVVNYRGSSGRGQAFSRAIFADWGNKEVQDLHGAVEHAIALGIADPNRLGIGGWSYGGILTDYAIATDTRFKAAVAGAGTGNWLTMYGTDQFVHLYENELGSPWAHLDQWLKVSYPFLHADRIKTPTMFLGGERDFNVPIAGGEQMYQALRTLGIDAKLVIYPGMFHGGPRPSYRRDIMERYLEWWGKYLKPAQP
jgi:dipeptidyl aminopeptidase/acylaminoacyl peptidase